MKLRLLAGTLCTAVLALRAEPPTELPELTIHSPRVANQAPVGTFAMPVSALWFEPRVDLQGRNFVEGQADVTIRGGIFENTGFRVGTMSIVDPQTGHYFAEIPIAPQMLGAPEVLTGVDVAAGTTNATAGAVAYTWRPIRTRGLFQAAAGPHGLWRTDLYQGYTRARGEGRAVGFDVSAAHSESNGPIAYGDHEFNRITGRMQWRGALSQTDLFAGYQSKFFGWPNLYTPFNSRESENLQTLLVSVNHRVDLGSGQFFSAGAYHRRNKDDYAFNRFAPVGPVHPFQHTTWQDGAALESRFNAAELVIHARAEVLADSLTSTSLTAGRYRSRTLTKVAVVPEKSWSTAPGEMVTAKAGVTYDDSNRDGGSVSPLVELARTSPAGALRRIYASFAQTTQVPTYTALNSSASSGLFRGNPNLGRERSRNVEAGASALVAGWTAQMALFARWDDALVDWTFRRGVTARTANPVDIETAGLEAVARRSWGRLDLVLGYTGLTKRHDYKGAPVDASFYALNYARHRLTAAAVLRLAPGLEIRVDNVARLQAPNLLRNSGGNSAVHTTVGVAYKPAGVRGLELSAQVDNVWNSRFQSIPAVPPTPRQWAAGVSYLW